MLNEVRNYSAWWQRDKMREECGVFGIYAPGMDVAQLTYFGLYALQHRGQESAGIAAASGSGIKLYKNMGLVPEVFGSGVIKTLAGHAAIGHVRYSTTGSSELANAQPLVFRHSKGMLSLAHNGNLTNVSALREMLYNNGAIFQSTTDSEVIVNLIARYSQQSLEAAIMKAMIDIEGAYSLVILTAEALYAVRDPYGFRPLCLGRVGRGWVVASESCALDTIGAEFIRDVMPGEIVRLDKDGLTSLQTMAASKPAHCIFEYIYFARPDSTIDGFHVNKVRREMGRRLAREYQVEADIVIPVPDSGTAAARGYAQEAGIPFEEGLMKNRYIGRTFIQPTQQMRDLGVRLKINPMREVLAGKRVIMVDDSLVRGTTSRKIVKMLRDAGVVEVHLCLSSPPVVAGCHYGIDTSDRKELIAAAKSVEEIRQAVGADGLYYLSQEGLLDIFGERGQNFCCACFDKKYPVQVPKDAGKFSLE
ncbi:amidophosphoribosyltransferase [Desulfohalotomaculum tongense]|uniref:amidophosphoribosyltransferase n=1 Tax=Desulforadius tongensis TaxID=1216062 RepID=UPI0019577753|nr:amidophosphoribosyltransferase [Desulforadius tongensis]MBM7854255.1 amidophosphoribosyltransferase [Desulforadius tongensis]